MVQASHTVTIKPTDWPHSALDRGGAGAWGAWWGRAPPGLPPALLARMRPARWPGSIVAIVIIFVIFGVEDLFRNLVPLLQ
jgi:hypothetical protein